MHWEVRLLKPAYVSFPSCPHNPCTTESYNPSIPPSIIALSDSSQLTQPLGLNMAEFPLNPMFARMLLMSGEQLARKREGSLRSFFNSNPKLSRSSLGTTQSSAEVL